MTTQQIVMLFKFNSHFAHYIKNSFLALYHRFMVVDSTVEDRVVHVIGVSACCVNKGMYLAHDIALYCVVRAHKTHASCWHVMGGPAGVVGDWV